MQLQHPPQVLLWRGRVKILDAKSVGEKKMAGLSERAEDTQL
jgi:hypothetical protein